MQRYRLIQGYPGCNADRFKIQDADGRLYVRYPEETCYAAGVWHDYAWSFNFGLQNTSAEKVDVEVFVNCRSPDECPPEPFILYTSRDPIKGFEPAAAPGPTYCYSKYYFIATIPAGETVYFSNTMPRDYETFINSLAVKARAHGVSQQPAGWTVEGRQIQAFVFGDLHNGKPNLLYTSGFHPAEGDSYAVEAVFDHLCGGSGRRWLRDFNVVLIPAANPDGFVHGTNGANLNGVNLYWNFAHEDKDRAPEAYSLWRYFREIKPVLYVDFHAYVTQPKKKMSPYVKPAGLYAGSRVRDIVKEMDAFLIGFSRGRFHSGYLTYARTTLAYLLTRDFNTITYTKFHFHLRNGVSVVQEQAVRIFDGLAEILKEHGVSHAGDVLLKPAGFIERSVGEKLCLRFLVAREELKNPLRQLRAALLRT